MPTLRMVQLPVPPPAAMAATGNVPLAAGCLAVAAQVHGLDRRLTIDLVAPDETDVLGDTLLADRVARDEPAYVGLSLYLWNVERSLHLAREIKTRSPRTRVLIGGPEVSADNPFVLAQEGFDVAVTGEAEATFAEILSRLLDGREPSDVQGVSSRIDGRMTPFGATPRADFALTEYPSPYLNGLVQVDPARSTYVETVRGCKSHCTFCFYPRSSNVLRTLDVARSAELIATLKARGAREVVFLDPTFNHRPGFVELVEALAEVNADRRLSFFAEVRAEGLTVEHAKLLARAGFTKLEIGLQSVNLATLKTVRRGGSPQRVATAAKMLKGEGIDLLVDLIVGLPGDTADDVARGVDFLLENDLGDSAQVFPLSLLPGTAMRAEAERDGLTFDPSPPYRVRNTPTMTESAWREALVSAEQLLGRRLDEYPRPHLIDGDEHTRPRDVFRIDLDDPDASEPLEPGARHVAIWFSGEDLFGSRDRILSILTRRLSIDPFATIDVVLRPGRPFILNLIDLIRLGFGRATDSYLSRVLAHRGEDLQRRISVVLPRELELPQDYLDALRSEVPVFRDQPAFRAIEDAAMLGESLPGARIIDREMDSRSWTILRQRADAEAVVFGSRRLERAWQRGVLGYGETADR